MTSEVRAWNVRVSLLAHPRDFWTVGKALTSTVCIHAALRRPPRPHPALVFRDQATVPCRPLHSQGPGLSHPGSFQNTLTHIVMWDDLNKPTLSLVYTTQAQESRATCPRQLQQPRYFVRGYFTPVSRAETRGWVCRGVPRAGQGRELPCGGQDPFFTETNMVMADGLRVCTWPNRCLFTKFSGQHGAPGGGSSSSGVRHVSGGSRAFAKQGLDVAITGRGHGCFFSLSLNLNSLFSPFITFTILTPCCSAAHPGRRLSKLIGDPVAPAPPILPTLGSVLLFPPDPSSTDREVQKPHRKASSFKLSSYS